MVMDPMQEQTGRGVLELKNDKKKPWDQQREDILTSRTLKIMLNSIFFWKQIEVNNCLYDVI